MKKIIFPLFFSIFLFTSCATVLGGSVDKCQRTKPAPGEPARKIRPLPLVCDIVLFLPGIAVDFLTQAIYKPCGK